jgi:hypothetical protein
LGADDVKIDEEGGVDKDEVDEVGIDAKSEEEGDNARLDESR